MLSVEAMQSNPIDVARALVRAASRLVSTLDCNLYEFRGKHRDESRCRTHECARHNAISNLSVMFVLLTTTTTFAQTPAAPQAPRPAMAATPNTDIYYKLAPDALPQDGVPKGAIQGPFTLPSQAYPGTQHTYWVYVPAQYDAATPASLMIYNDGQAFLAPEGDIRAQVVMDNLIYRLEIPAMISVFINPGRRPDQP